MTTHNALEHNVARQWIEYFSVPVDGQKMAGLRGPAAEVLRQVDVAEAESLLGDVAELVGHLPPEDVADLFRKTLDIFELAAGRHAGVRQALRGSVGHIQSMLFALGDVSVPDEQPQAGEDSSLLAWGAAGAPVPPEDVPDPGPATQPLDVAEPAPDPEGMENGNGDATPPEGNGTPRRRARGRK